MSFILRENYIPLIIKRENYFRFWNWFGSLYYFLPTIISERFYDDIKWTRRELKCFLILWQWKRFVSLANQQQLDCLLKHIEHSQNLNLWSKQTESSGNEITSSSRRYEAQVVNSNTSSFPVQYQSHPTSSVTIQQQQSKPKLEWVVLPVFVDIVKLALKAREDCSTRYVCEWKERQLID